MARDLPLDLRASGYGEWTFFFTDYLVSPFLNICELYIVHDFIFFLEAVHIITVIIIECVASMH